MGDPRRSPMVTSPFVEPRNTSDWRPSCTERPPSRLAHMLLGGTALALSFLVGAAPAQHELVATAHADQGGNSGGGSGGGGGAGAGLGAGLGGLGSALEPVSVSA